MLAHELVQLSMQRDVAVRHGHDVAVVKLPVGGPLDESSADRHSVLPCKSQKLLCRLPLGNRLGERLDALARELANVPVTR